MHASPEHSNEPRTALAFLVAPAVPSALVSLLLCTFPEPDRLGLGFAAFLFACFAVVGYATALVIGVPLYLMIPEWARWSFPIVTALGGVVAAAPWAVLIAASRGGADAWAAVAAIFGLGSIGGIAFLFVRNASADVPPSGEVAP